MEIPQGFMDLCRLCASDFPVKHHIFKVEGINYKIAEKISTCLSIKVTPQDSFPKAICENCLCKLQQMYEFHKSTKNVELYLSSVLEPPKNIEYVNREYSSLQPDVSQIHLNVLMAKKYSIPREIMDLQKISKDIAARENIDLIGSESITENTNYIPLELNKTAKKANDSLTVIDSNQAEKISKKTVVLPNSLHIIKKSDAMLFPVSNSTILTDDNVDSKKPLEEDVFLFRCQICDIMFSNPVVYEAHVKESHSDANPLRSAQHNEMQKKVSFKCKTCNRVFPTSRAISTHVRFAHKIRNKKKHLSQKITPAVSTKTLYSQITVDPQLDMINVPTSDPVFHCSQCQIHFKCSHDLQTHIKVEHKMDYKCNVCKERFRTAKILAIHKKKHLDDLLEEEKKKNEKNHICDICGKKFFKNCMLKKHIKIIHLKERPYSCTYCSKAFQSNHYLKTHMTIHEQKFTHVCSYCGKGVRSNSALVYHVRKHHTGEMPFSCEECDKRFFMRHFLTTHKKEVHSEEPRQTRIYHCNICEKTFPNQDRMRYHVLGHTVPLAQRKKHKCSVCDSSFLGQHSLNIHMRRHTGEKPHACHLCTSRYATKKGLKLHLDVHSGVKNFACEFCGKTFAQEYTLIAHRRTHTGERPFECDICHSRFTQKSALNTHRKNVHGMKHPFNCQMCGKGLNRESDLISHIREHHP